ncbi:MAG TPA: hypothetical protein VIX89_20320 [Bryobacteraceae bacterium]
MRNALLLLLRVCGYIYHFALCLFLLGLGITGAASGRNNLKLPMLPWEGAALTRAVTILGVLGIVCVLLAITGKLRWLFPLWALFVFVMMFRGFFLSSYSFAGAGQFKFDVWLTAGALAVFLVSLSLFGRGSKKYR